MILDDVWPSATYTNYQTMGTDDAPQLIIKASLLVIGFYILKFSNSSLIKSMFSNIWKESRVLTNNKASNPVTMNNVNLSLMFAVKGSETSSAGAVLQLY